MARRGAELPPTARMVWSRSIADAVIAAASAGGIGIALSCVIMLLAVVGGASDGLQPIGLSILAVSAGAAALFSAMLGPAFAAVNLARMRMYRGAAPGSVPLRNAVEFRGQATSSSLFPLEVTLVCVAGAGALAAIVSGILWAQEPDAVYRDAMLCCTGFVVLAVLGVLICRGITRHRLAPVLAGLPAGAVGQRDADETILADTRENRRLLAARARRVSTPLDNARSAAGWCLAAAVVGVGATARLRHEPAWSWLAIAAAVLAAVCVVALIVLHLARWIQLTRLPGVLRGSPTEVEQERGRSLTRDLRDQMLATMILWSLAAYAGMGLVRGEDVVATSSGRTLGLLGILILWVAGLSLLTWLRVRLERLGPLLREEFGYDVPVRTASGDSSPGLV
ncbi:hypothetical protein [Microbacterium arabinogalactanolyticum]|uniref:Integral membrane protein n=1 Tax=Microbacterium arabinogalactanolyticum TaxID=69365 RepID=A0ABQ5NEN4_9MICO|nr:hypothetical protein [Microbacterium arabinogalactanolyticum]GLC84113.1 hypothetical protein MIAR_07010 [Microbacterium arabinogalactanolyticum]